MVGDSMPYFTPSSCLRKALSGEYMYTQTDGVPALVVVPRVVTISFLLQFRCFCQIAGFAPGSEREERRDGKTIVDSRNLRISLVNGESRRILGLPHHSLCRSGGAGCCSPSTGTLRPLIQFARGEARNTITSATSSGLPRRPIGRPSRT